MASNEAGLYSKSGQQFNQQLIEQYTGLVKRIAHHLAARLPSQVQLDDLLQAGMIGLLEAAKKYDGSKGATFETYAGIRVRGAMLDEIRKGDWVPRSVHRNSRRITEAISALEARLGRDAKDSEIAEELGLGLTEYHQLLSDTASSRLFSFEELLSSQDGRHTWVADQQQSSPPTKHQTEQFKKALANAIATLPEREQLLLSLYYDEELNLKEIGMVLGVSESRVSQLHSQAAARLRARLNDWAVE
ncbi:RNA polymerase sigma factor FliA [Spartinivicinus ruber]|uniref:RNA polymerase sigma factor FliA n=1 Tax=Spartinivicinus ruber TaxID=2683272 RepID=UPI0013D877FB|nr:RNA polymerase sigma factor FliA [Spartinivicinus ruber]